MPDEENVRRVSEYLEKHRDRYDRMAMMTNLVRAGFDPVDLDEAERRVFGPEPYAHDPALRGTLPALTREVNVPAVAALLALFNLFVLPVILMILNFESALVLGMPLVLLAEAVTAFALRWRHRSLSKGIYSGIGITLIPIVGIALLVGLCLLIYGF